MDFTKPYQRDEWIDFLQTRFLPEDFEIIEEPDLILEHNYHYIKRVQLIGKTDSLGMKVYEIHHTSADDPRISLTRESFKLMSSYGERKCLALFTSTNDEQYRFSLITIDLNQEISNPKRYSFILGEGTKTHTPEEYLVQKGRVINFEDLKDRFSIEVVNKEFYKKVAELFTKLTGGIRKIGNKNEEFETLLKLPSEDDHETLQRFSVRLIGRLVFCWFLKKKKSKNNISLVPEEILSVKAINENKHYYHSILEPLFFEVLNTPIKERKEFIHNDTRWNNVPFLNGGLFDPNLHEDFYAIDEIFHRSKYENTLKIPDGWLKELFEIFETYNFTIDENTSVDIDLSVDPEMLGRIFENLLAEINPETEKTARKATGSYYTPRPIVEYMVDESLIQYLLTKTDVDEVRIRNLLNYTVEESNLDKEETEQVIDALDEIKVLDPACGSGAFPMGILQKMLLILEKVDPGSAVWLIKQLDKIPNPSVKNAIEEELMSKDWRYIHKMGIIQNAIYGVDIQVIATEISKLRLFLTLIVDENIQDEKDNRGVNYLPNLSFKFVAANTLIGLPQLKTQGDAFERKHLEPIVKKLNELRNEFFHAINKEKIEIQFKEQQRKLGEYIAESGSQNELAIALANWEPFKEKSSDWFEPWWMFGIKEGFDIIISNPPYGAKIPSFVEKKVKLRLSDTKNPNSASYFIDVCKNEYIKQKGTLTLIVPKSLLYSENWFSLVLALLPNTISLLDVEKGFEDVLLEQVVFVYSSKLSKYYKALKYNDREIKGVNEIDKSVVLKLKAWICDVSKSELDILLNKLIFLNKMHSISKTTRGLPYQKYLGTLGDYRTIGGKNIQRYYLRGFKGYLSKELIQSNKKARSLLCTKILSQRLVAHIQNPYPHMKIISTLDKNGSIIGVDTVENTVLIESKLSYKYILALLNSKLLSWYLYKFIFCSAIRTTDLDNNYIGKLPINYSEKENIFNNLVDSILDKKENDENTVSLESLLDIMVFKVYELTSEEAKIVDPGFDDVLAEFGLSKEDYERMSVSDFAELRRDEKYLVGKSKVNNDIKSST